MPTRGLTADGLRPPNFLTKCDVDLETHGQPMRTQHAVLSAMHKMHGWAVDVLPLIGQAKGERAVYHYKSAMGMASGKLPTLRMQRGVPFN